MGKGLKILIAVVILVVIVSTCAFIINTFFGENAFSFLKKLNINVNLSLIEDKVLEEEFLGFENLNVDVNAGKVEIKNGDSEKTKVIIYSSGKNNRAYIKDNDLFVEAKVKNCKFFCFNRKIAKVEIYLPSSYSNTISVNNKLGDIIVDNFSDSTVDINLSAGDIKLNSAKVANIDNHFGDIKVSGNVNVLNVNEDCGDVKVFSVNIANINNHLGDIEVDRINERANINDDCGDIEIDKLYITFESKITNNAGDVEIKETNNINIKAKTSLGENKVYNSNSDSDITLTINNSLGDIKVNY